MGRYVTIRQCGWYSLSSELDSLSLPDSAALYNLSSEWNSLSLPDSAGWYSLSTEWDSLLCQSCQRVRPLCTQYKVSSEYQGSSST